jgi:predicted AAA+ superfamily ATPase
MSRNTNTGGVLESMVIPALTRGGYEVEKQVHVGLRLGKKGKHKVDAIATKDDAKILVSSKWQQTSGTAEEKVPYEVMCLAEAMKEDSMIKKAYVVLGGDGWSLRDFYISGGLKKFMQNVDGVKVITLERFIALANKAEL